MAASTEPRVIHQGPGGVGTLPPAGDARREVLAQRTDELAAKAEELGAAGGTISQQALEPDRDILQHTYNAQGVNEMEVPNARPDYVYKWEQCDPQRKLGNRHFLSARAQGWDRVLAKDPDAEGLEHCIAPDGSIIVGDTILLRIPRARYIMLRRLQYEATRRLELGVDADLRERAERAGVRVFDTEGLQALNSGWTAAQEANARAIAQERAAWQRLDQDIRGGTVPGAPASAMRRR